MKFKVLLLIPIVFISFLVNAQSTSEIENSSVYGQFTKVVDGSNKYTDERGQRYKVVKIEKLTVLQKNVLDTIASFKKSILEKNSQIGTQATHIKSLENTLSTSENNLTASKEKENGILLFGILMSKASYNTIMWSIIGTLLLGLIMFILKFKKSNAITKEAKQKLAETEKEFEDYRQKKLEELQKTRRKLQDEINKNR